MDRLRLWSGGDLLKARVVPERDASLPRRVYRSGRGKQTIPELRSA